MATTELNKIKAKQTLRFFTDDGDPIKFKCYWVRSSNVKLIGYPETGGYPMMLVVYNSGQSYGYLGVPRQAVTAAAHSRSVGEYIFREVKPNHEVVRLKI